MNKYLVEYEQLCEQFLNGTMSVDVFSETFIDRFKVEKHLDEPFFLLLDEPFGNVDSFTTDTQLLAENPDFYLDEVDLREKVQQTVDRLLEIRKERSGTGLES